MDKKKIILLIVVVLITGFSIYTYINKHDAADKIDNINKIEKQDNKSLNLKELTNKKTVEDKKTSNNEQSKSTNIETQETSENNIIHTNLYNDLSSTELPLSAITELSALPHNIQNVVYDISKNGNIYMIQKNHNKLLIIADNPENIRHSIEFTEVSLSNGHKIKTTLGYNDTMKDSQNDIWEYNHETGQPIRHTKYNSDGDMEFVEIWNYAPDEPIKYEMKNADGKVISMRKETLKDGTDLRIEHLLYDRDGNTQINVSATYDGADIKRFTYYNAEKINESGSIFSEYSDGQKTKETVYTSDLKVKNTYTSNYKDGNRDEIIKWDNQNKEIKKYLPVDKL